MTAESRDLHQDGLAESAVLGRITAHHSEFLGFIAARVGEPAAAEDILQSAYVKALEHGSQLRDEESVVGGMPSSTITAEGLPARKPTSCSGQKLPQAMMWNSKRRSVRASAM